MINAPVTGNLPVPQTGGGINPSTSGGLTPAMLALALRNYGQQGMAGDVQTQGNAPYGQ